MTAEEFIKQYEELQLKTPRLSLSNTKGVNTEYANWSINNKDCYMIFAADHNEDCFNSRWLYWCKDSADCNSMHKSILCYECLDTNDSYNCDYCQDCETCTECSYCQNCVGCTDCLGCSAQRRAQYKILNKQFTKEEYFAKKEQILELIKTPEGQRQFEDKFEEVKISVPHKYIHGNHNENCTGDYIYHSKNCHDCYNVNDAEDCGYLIDAVNKTKDCYDIMAMEEAQMCYEGISNWGFNMSFCVMSWFSSNMEYCELCQTCQDCFGCIGMRSKKFHILNEPYEEAEYRRITKSIKDDMRSKNLYNRWFPPSTFKYEDTLAQDIWPRPTPKTSAGRTI